MADFGKEKAPARRRILDLLWDLQWHTWREIHVVGGVRYSARILELKRLGYDIETEGDKVEGLRYRLLGRQPGEPQQKRVKVFFHERDVRKILAHGNLSLEARAALEMGLTSFEKNREKL